MIENYLKSLLHHLLEKDKIFYIILVYFRCYITSIFCLSYCTLIKKTTNILFSVLKNIDSFQKASLNEV